jgi:hypothetical protein
MVTSPFRPWLLAMYPILKHLSLSIKKKCQHVFAPAYIKLK